MVTNADAYVVYSVGVNGKDDQGEIAAKPVERMIARRRGHYPAPPSRGASAIRQRRFAESRREARMLQSSTVSVKSTATMRDGKKLAATNIITRVDADHFTWQSTKRSADGKALPDTDVVKMKRTK